MNEFDSIILGNGITGSYFNYFLSNKLAMLDNGLKHRVAVLSSSIFSGVNPNIHIIISRNGIERNQSALGDLLVSGHEFFCEEFSRYDGVRPCPQFFIRNHPAVNEAKFVRRFGDVKRPLELPVFGKKFVGSTLSSFIVEPEKFINSIQSAIYHDCHFFDCDVVSSSFSPDGVILSALDGRKFGAKNLMVAAGAYAKLLPPRFYDSTHLMRHKGVAGGIWDSQFNFGSSDFILTLGMANLIYLAKSQKVQLSGASNNRGIEVTIKKKLEAIHHAFSQVVDLPAFKHGEIIQSLRDKGKSRYPMSRYFMESGCKVMIQCGAYKNGYTTSPYMINDLFNQSAFFG